jgi:hypothetical protein
MKITEHATEAARGERFEFGANCAQFLNVLNDARILLAEQSLRNMLGLNDLDGKRFLDIGSGSGLFSLVARRLGATMHSFDYDPQSVACTAELKRRYYPDDPDWVFEKGSALGKDYLHTLGQWDIVYSWGGVASHGRYVAGARKRNTLGATRRRAFYRYLQPPAGNDSCMDLGKARLQPATKGVALAGTLAGDNPSLGTSDNLRSATRKAFSHLPTLC